MIYVMSLCLLFAFITPGILAGEASPIPDCGNFETVCCDGEHTEKVPTIGAVVHGCTQYGKIKKCEHPELWWCCSSFNPPPGSNTGPAIGCDEAWPDHVLCPSLPNRKAKRRPGNLSRRNKCDERQISDFIQKLPTPGILPIPGVAPPIGAPGFIPINYEQPSSLNTAPLLTSIQDNAPGSGLPSDSTFGTGQPSSSSYWPQSSGASVLSQLATSDGGVDTHFGQTNAFSSS